MPVIKGRGIEIARKIYDFIEKYTSEYGYSPSIREIVNGTGEKFSTVYFYMQKLERIGVISRVDGTSRTVRIVKEYEPS